MEARKNETTYGAVQLMPTTKNTPKKIETPKNLPNGKLWVASGYLPVSGSRCDVTGRLPIGDKRREIMENGWTVTFDELEKEINKLRKQCRRLRLTYLLVVLLYTLFCIIIIGGIR